MTKICLAILASGSGSNAESIMKWASQSTIAEVVCVGSNKKTAKVLERAQNYNIESFVVLKQKNEETVSYDQRLLEKLKFFSPDWIILAGYMRLLSAEFLSHYPNRVINIHPSLLPAFPGVDGYGEAFRANVKESGCTIHYVDAGIDTGAIIAQKKLAKIPGENFEDFKARGLIQENQFYPEILEKLLKGNL